MNLLDVRSRPATVAVFLFAAALDQNPASADDWPQWQGPNRDAVSKETGLLQKWPSAGPRLAWRVEGLGGGYGAPSVAAGRLYGISSRGADEVVWARSEADGKELWATRLGPALTEGMPQGREGAGCTPTVDGDRLYVLGLAGDLACVAVADGKVVWQRNLQKDFGGRLPTWRYNELPLLDGDAVVCTPGGAEATIVALDKATGKTRWQSKVPDPPAGSGGAPRGTGGPGGRAGGPGGGFDLMRAMPVLAALDADGNREVSPEEIEGSPAALGKLDKNGDGTLTEEELRPEAGGAPPQGGRPQGGPGGPPGGLMKFLPVLTKLDADESGKIEAGEIEKAAAALKKLDANSDGKLAEDELRPQFGGRGGRGGFGGGSTAAYSSAIAVDFAGRRQYVQFTAKSVVGVAADDGKVLWQYAKPANGAGINCSTPIYRDGSVFAASAYGAGGGLVKLADDGSGGVKAEEVWFSGDIENHHGGVVFHDGGVYGANGGNGGGYLVCLDEKSGELLWRDRKAPKGSVAFADGRLYYRTEDAGTLLLIEPSKEKLVERGRFEQPDRSRSPAWSHPVIANGKLYVRDQDLLLCYDVASK